MLCFAIHISLLPNHEQMLGKLLQRLKSTPSSEEPAPVSSHDLGQLRMLRKHFPIGRKLRYFPEYHRDAILDTVIIAYRVNDAYLYTNEEVAIEEDDPSRAGFRLDSSGWLPFSKLKDFYLVVPDTSESIRQLDYFTRAELGPSGQFRLGNTITLFTESSGRGIPSLDTEVFRKQEMKDGPYASNPVVLLAPDFSSLAIKDKRQTQRVQACVAAQLYYGKGGQSILPCVMQDFSEHSMRIVPAEVGQAMPQLKKNEKVYAEFFLGDSVLPYRFQGKVWRQNESDCVIKIELQHCGGEFKKPRRIDLAEIKTLLLNSNSAIRR